MKKPTKNRKYYEGELIYYLRLFNELKGREGVTHILELVEDEINKLVDNLKQM